MTTGEKTFSTKDRAVTKPQPIPEGTYEATFRPNSAEARLPKNVKEGLQLSDGIPYVTAQLELIGTSLSEGGKNRVVFPMFFLDTRPNERGEVSLDSSSGLTGLARAMDTDLEGIEVVTREASNGTVQEFLNARQVAEWLNSKAGETFKVRIGIKAAKGQYEASNVVKGYVPVKK